MGIGKHKDSVLGRSDFSEIYWAQFRKHVFTLIKMGYHQLEVSSLSNAEEPDITGKLAKEIDRITQDRNAPKWASSFSVYDDPPVNIPGKHGKHRPRIDLRIDRTRHGPRPSYQFEAKRLGPNNGVSKYLGVNGLGMFTAGTYAHECHEAGMLGYIQKDSTAIWADKIFRKLKDNASKNIGEWVSIEVVAALESYRTQHQRSTIGKPITIFHLMLLFQ